MLPVNNKWTHHIGNLVAYFIFTAVALFIYWGPITHPRVVGFDDEIVVSPIVHAESLAEYLKLRSQVIILDFQPIRDLSYFIEGKIELITHFQNRQMINVLLWISCLIVLFQILERLKENKLWNFILCLIVLCHPIAVNSVAWPSARKHLLAALFLLLATKTTMGSARGCWRKTSIWIYFLLSTLSQPINILWPLWLGLKARSRPKLKSAFMVSSLIAVILLVINNFYYTRGYYRVLTGAGKLGAFTDVKTEMLRKVFALGRYCYQLLIPLNPSVNSYYKESVLNVYGFACLGLLICLIYLTKPRSFLNSWLIILGGPIALMISAQSEHFGWDTYLVMPLLMIPPLFVTAWKKSESTTWPHRFASHSRNCKLIFGVLISISIFLSSLSHYFANQWTDDRSMWEISVKNDPNEIALSALAIIYLEIDHDFAKTKETLAQLIALNDKSMYLAYPLGELIFLKSKTNLTADSLFKKFNFDHIWFRYYEAMQKSSEGKFIEAEMELRRCLDANPINFNFIVQPLIPEFLATWMFACKKAKKPDCEEFLSKKLQLLPTYKWDQGRYEKKLKKLSEY